MERSILARVAAAVALVGLTVGACQAVDRSPTTSSGPTGTVPGPITPEMLATIIVTDANVPDKRLSVHRTLSGVEALRASETAPEDSAGFIDALLTDFDRDDDHDGEHEDLYGSFGAVFATDEDAERAFDAAVSNHESAQGWGLDPDQVYGDQASDPGFGDESIHYVDGSDYGYPEVSVYLWRVDNLLLHAVDFHPYDLPDLLETIAREMNDRAGG